MHIQMHTHTHTRTHVCARTPTRVKNEELKVHKQMAKYFSTCLVILQVQRNLSIDSIMVTLQATISLP